MPNRHPAAVLRQQPASRDDSLRWKDLAAACRGSRDDVPRPSARRPSVFASVVRREPRTLDLQPASSYSSYSSSSSPDDDDDDDSFTAEAPPPSQPHGDRFDVANELPFNSLAEQPSAVGNSTGGIRYTRSFSIQSNLSEVTLPVELAASFRNTSIRLDDGDDYDDDDDGLDDHRDIHDNSSNNHNNHSSSSGHPSTFPPLPPPSPFSRWSSPVALPFRQFERPQKPVQQRTVEEVGNRPAAATAASNNNNNSIDRSTYRPHWTSVVNGPLKKPVRQRTRGSAHDAADKRTDDDSRTATTVESPPLSPCPESPPVMPQRRGSMATSFVPSPVPAAR